MEAIIEQSLTRSVSYQEYRNIVTELISRNLSTGHTQSDELLHYSTLNEARMNRLDKTLKVPAELSAALNQLRSEFYWLVISEGWCGDAAQLLPIFNKLADTTNKIDLRIVFRDDNPDLMDLFLTGTARSIPKLIIINKSGIQVSGQFGPRPTEAAALVRNYKEKHGVIDEQIKTDLQMWYLHDKGISTMKELTELMALADR